MKNILYTILGIMMIGFFAYGIMQLFIWLFHSDIKIIAGFFAFFSAISGAFITQYYIKIREEKNAHREKKIKMYSKFVDTAQRLIASSNKNLEVEEMKEEDLLKFLYEFNKDIVLWGSPGVIKALLEFRKSSENKTNNRDILSAMDKLYREFRKDIGLSNLGLNSRELIKVNLSDPEELDRI